MWRSHLGRCACLAILVGCSSAATSPADNTANSGSPQQDASGGTDTGAGSSGQDAAIRGGSGSNSGSPSSSGATGSSGTAGSGSTGPGGVDAGAVNGTSDDAGAILPTDSGATKSAVDAALSSVDAGAFPDQFQQHNLDVINKYRASGGLKPLTLDAALSTFALAGSQELTVDHIPHQHFMTAGKALFTPANGFKTSAGENQGDPNGWTVASQNTTTNELTQIDEIMKAMFDEGPAGDAGVHGHYLNMMSTTFTRVGVGLIEVSGRLYLTNDFSN